jgi:RNase P/RNase MRP subunit POP5
VRDARLLAEGVRNTRRGRCARGRAEHVAAALACIPVGRTFDATPMLVAPITMPG